MADLNIFGTTFSNASGFKIEDTEGNLRTFTEGSGVEPVQSDWNEEGTTSLAHVLNRPAIRAGEGENSIVEGQIEQDEDAAEYTLTISGAANATTFTYTTTDTLPTSSNLKAYAIASYPYSSSTTYYRKVESIDSTNLTITLDSKLSTSAITNGTLTIYYKYKNAVGKNSHAEGQMTNAYGSYSHAEGVRTNALGNNGSHAEGSGTAATGAYSHAEGSTTRASGGCSHAEGYSTVATGSYSHVEGKIATASGEASHAEGTRTIASNQQAHAEGIQTTASGDTSHAEGVGGTASAFGSHVEGGYSSYYINLSGEANALTYTATTEFAVSHMDVVINSHIRSNNSWAATDAIVTSATLDADNKIISVTLDKTLNATAAVSGQYVINFPSKATGNFSHAEGAGTYASGYYSHSEGYGTTASGTRSHAEGYQTTASGVYSHSENYRTIASGEFSHADGAFTIAQRESNHVFGQYNLPDTGGTGVDSHGNYIEIVGNGTADATRSNARTLDWSGNEVLAGKLTVGAGPVNNMDVATKQYVDTAVSSGGSSDVMIIHITTQGSNYSADKTYAEISSHLNNGGTAVLIEPYNSGNANYVLNCIDYDTIEQGFILFATCTIVREDGANYYRGHAFAILADDSVEYVSEAQGVIPSIPSTTPLQDGTAAIGSSSAYAKADHVHPKITQTLSMSSNVITLTGSDGTTSSVTLPVYNGGVSVVSGGAS